MKLLGGNVDSSVGYLTPTICQQIRGVNGNHIRLFPWSGFSVDDAADISTLQSQLDLAYTNGVKVTLCLSLREWQMRTFIRGYPVPHSWSPSDPYVTAPVLGDIALSKSDFFKLFTAVASKPALHSWELNNEPWGLDWNGTNETDSAKIWCQSLTSYIKTLDMTHPVYVGITEVLKTGGTTADGITYPSRLVMLTDAGGFCDILAFHYYLVSGYQYWDSIMVRNQILTGSWNFANNMNVVRQANISHNLPVWIDEFGIASGVSPTGSGYAYTDDAGQAAYHDEVLKQVSNYPEIRGLNFWQANSGRRYSVFGRPAEAVIRSHFLSLNAAGKWMFKQWQDGDINPMKTLTL